MANYDNNEAYDLSLFLPREAREAQEKENKKVQKKPQLVREKPKTAKELHLERKNRRQRLMKLTLICSLMLFLVGSVLHSRAESARLNVVYLQRKDLLDEAIEVNNSLIIEKTKLCTPARVEEFAKQKGMQKNGEIINLNAPAEDKFAVDSAEPAG